MLDGRERGKVRRRKMDLLTSWLQDICQTATRQRILKNAESGRVLRLIMMVYPGSTDRHSYVLHILSQAFAIIH